MLARFYSRASLVPSEVAKEFGVSERTVLRDLNRLKESGCPIEKKSGAYRIKNCVLEDVAEYTGLIKTTQKAIKKHRNVVVKKDGEKFVIAPLKIENIDGLWRLVGIDTNGRELRLRLKEIIKIKRQKGI
jgi:DNA-binding Lrp family transcriptional regulator